jgi:hypothetical protein
MTPPSARPVPARSGRPVPGGGRAPKGALALNRPVGTGSGDKGIRSLRHPPAQSGDTDGSNP